MTNIRSNGVGPCQGVSVTNIGSNDLGPCHGVLV